jgi:hypothetical protein
MPAQNGRAALVQRGLEDEACTLMKAAPGSLASTASHCADGASGARPTSSRHRTTAASEASASLTSAAAHSAAPAPIPSSSASRRAFARRHCAALASAGRPTARRHASAAAHAASAACLHEGRAPGKPHPIPFIWRIPAEAEKWCGMTVGPRPGAPVEEEGGSAGPRHRARGGGGVARQPYGGAPPLLHGALCVAGVIGQAQGLPPTGGFR